MGDHLHRQRATLSIKTNMKVISAYLLAVVGGNATPSADDVTAILGSVGIALDGDASSQLDALISEMEGKSVDEVLAAAGRRSPRSLEVDPVVPPPLPPPLPMVVPPPLPRRRRPVRPRMTVVVEVPCSKRTTRFVILTSRVEIRRE